LLQSRKLESFLRVSCEAGHAERALKSLFVDDALHAGCKVPSAAPIKVKALAVAGSRLQAIEAELLR
jgi:hypothetical protein